jgi:hypothetical protein
MIGIRPRLRQALAGKLDLYRSTPWARNLEGEYGKGEGFFIFSRRNSLKSLDSEK